MVGVYIIWHGGLSPAVVRIGQGIIRDRLASHRDDPTIMAYKHLGLFVTWAPVHSSKLDAVERYLADTWKPKVGDRFPNVLPLAVTSPWS
ncbi:hypothetical protein K2Q00_03475 [Patescibacteria group bacterium]|nr:hypothetical protein [Patescibacteria group bacterium]